MDLPLQGLVHRDAAAVARAVLGDDNQNEEEEVSQGRRYLSQASHV